MFELIVLRGAPPNTLILLSIMQETRRFWDRQPVIGTKAKRTMKINAFVCTQTKIIDAKNPVEKKLHRNWGKNILSSDI